MTVFYTLRELLRSSGGRSLEAQNRAGRRAQVLGLGPAADVAVGWWVGGNEIILFSADKREWSRAVTYD